MRIIILENNYFKRNSHKRIISFPRVSYFSQVKWIVSVIIMFPCYSMLPLGNGKLRTPLTNIESDFKRSFHEIIMFLIDSEYKRSET